MANMRPAGFKEEARPIMTFLFDTRQYDYYFALYNLLISRLFSDRAIAMHKRRPSLCISKAKGIGQPVGMAMAP